MSETEQIFRDLYGDVLGSEERQELKNICLDEVTDDIDQLFPFEITLDEKILKKTNADCIIFAVKKGQLDERQLIASHLTENVKILTSKFIIIWKIIDDQDSKVFYFEVFNCHPGIWAYIELEFAGQEVSVNVSECFKTGNKKITSDIVSFEVTVPRMPKKRGKKKFGHTNFAVKKLCQYITETLTSV